MSSYITVKIGKAELVIDTEYAYLLEKHSYHLASSGRYFRRRSYIKGSGGKCISTQLHHDIIGRPPDGMVVDHINRNTFDNRRCNLRFASQSQNMQNRKVKSKTGFIGVTHQYKGYAAMASIDRKLRYILYSRNPVLCAIAYDDFQLKHRENPRLNFPTIRARKKALVEWSAKNVST